jgi:hypothetical protein
MWGCGEEEVTSGTTPLMATQANMIHFFFLA